MTRRQPTGAVCALMHADRPIGGFGLHIGSCSCLGLQKLINICMAYGLQWDIRFNPAKSQIACFGSKSPVCDCINNNLFIYLFII